MNTQSPGAHAHIEFHDAQAAVTQLRALYHEAVGFLCDRFMEAMRSGPPDGRVRAFYPEIRFTTTTYSRVDTRLSFGHVSNPGTYATTVTRPDLFENYLVQQIGLLIANHDRPVEIGYSNTPMPVHFAVANDPDISVPQ